MAGVGSRLTARGRWRPEAVRCSGWGRLDRISGGTAGVAAAGKASDAAHVDCCDRSTLAARGAAADADADVVPVARGLTACVHSVPSASP